MGSCFDYNSYTLLVLDCATMSGSQIVDESQNLERMNGQIGKEAENDTRAGEKKQGRALNAEAYPSGGFGCRKLTPTGLLGRGAGGRSRARAVRRYASMHLRLIT